jgi:PBP1b-binding outer membrane lipoprotein LpoB
MQTKPVLRFVVVPAVAFLTLLGAAGCGSSHPKPKASSTPSVSAGAMACQHLNATLATAQTQLESAISHPATARAKAAAFLHRLATESAGASAKVRLAVAKFAVKLRAALVAFQSGHADIGALTTSLTRAAGRISAACQSP